MKQFGLWSRVSIFCSAFICIACAAGELPRADWREWKVWQDLSSCRVRSINAVFMGQAVHVQGSSGSRSVPRQLKMTFLRNVPEIREVLAWLQTQAGRYARFRKGRLHPAMDTFLNNRVRSRGWQVFLEHPLLPECVAEFLLYEDLGKRYRAWIRIIVRKDNSRGASGG